jgi:ribonuclease P protein component
VIALNFGAIFLALVNKEITPLAKQFTLGKKERLKSRKAIEHLFKEGNRFNAGPFRIFFAFLPEQGIAMGAGVSARNFKKAVDRNRIKRLIREAYRHQKLSLQQKLFEKGKGLHVFIIYTAKELPLYSEVYESLHSILNRLIKKTDENIAANT